MPPPPPTSPMLINPCINASYPQSKQKWCNPTVEVNDRVADMIARMSLAEKIGALRDSSAPIPSLGLPYYDWWNEASNIFMYEYTDRHRRKHRHMHTEIDTQTRA